MNRVLLIALLLGSSSALAAPTLLPASQSNPPRFIDEASTWISLGNDSEGYYVTAGTLVANPGENDRVRLDVRSGKKVVSSIECGTGWSSEAKGMLEVKCGAYRDKHLKLAGPLEVDLVYEDDKDDKHYLLRTLKMNVKHWDKQWWQIEPDDVLGSAWAWRRGLQLGNTTQFRFWVANKAGFPAVMRCTANGKPVPDIEGDVNEVAPSTSIELIKNNAHHYWHWTLGKFESHKLYTTVENQRSPMHVYLTDYPGAWECQVRKDGAVIRELRFTVDKNGIVESQPMQLAKGAAPVADNVSVIDVRIVKDNGLDQRIKPDQIKKSRMFGAPWPQHESVKAIHAALPPKYENVNPVAVKPKGKLIVGTEAKPPRFIDESSAIVRVSRDMDGYQFSVRALVGGVSHAQGNAYRVDWKQGNKIVGTAKCSWTKTQEGGISAASVECDYRDKPLTAKGPIEAHLIQHDDVDGNEYLLRVFRVTVAKYPNKFPKDAAWQLVPDDVLATAWVRQWEDALYFRFWLATESADPSLRCTVNGSTKLPDISLSGSSSDASLEAAVMDKKGDTTEYVWQFNDMKAMPDVLPGPPPKDAKKDDQYVRHIGLYPGQWDCAMRSKGKVIRQLLFTVNKDGWIEADPAQEGPPAFPTVVPIDMRFGKDASSVDLRIRPAAMKKSRGFGLPWPKPPTKPFPAASGLPDPK